MSFEQNGATVIHFVIGEYGLYFEKSIDEHCFSKTRNVAQGTAQHIGKSRSFIQLGENIVRVPFVSISFNPRDMRRVANMCERMQLPSRKRHNRKEWPVHDGDSDVTEFFRYANQRDLGDFVLEPPLAEAARRADAVEAGIGAIQHAIGSDQLAVSELHAMRLTVSGLINADDRCRQANFDAGFGQPVAHDLPEYGGVEGDFIDLICRRYSSRIKETPDTLPDWSIGCANLGEKRLEVSRRYFAVVACDAIDGDEIAGDGVAKFVDEPGEIDAAAQCRVHAPRGVIAAMDACLIDVGRSRQEIGFPFDQQYARQTSLQKLRNTGAIETAANHQRIELRGRHDRALRRGVVGAGDAQQELTDDQQPPG